MDPAEKKPQNIAKTKEQLQQMTRNSNRIKEQASKKKYVENIEGTKYVYSFMDKRNETKTGSNRRFFILNSCINFGYVSKLEEKDFLPFDSLEKIPKRKQIVPLERIIDINYQKNTLLINFKDEEGLEKKWQIICANEAMAIDWKIQLKDACAQKKLKQQNKPIILDIPPLPKPQQPTLISQSSPQQRPQYKQNDKPQPTSTNNPAQKPQIPQTETIVEKKIQKSQISRPESIVFKGSIQSGEGRPRDLLRESINAEEKKDTLSQSRPLVTKFDGSAARQSSKNQSQKDKAKEQYMQKRKKQQQQRLQLQGDGLKSIFNTILDPNFQLQKLKAEWWYEMAKGGEEYYIFERFKLYVELVARRIIDELGQEERKRYYRPKNNLTYIIDNVEIEVIISALQEAQDRTTLVSPARAKEVRQEMNNYNYILQLTRNKGKIRVPLMVLVQYKGFLVSGKANTQLISTYQNPQVLQKQLLLLEKQSKIDNGLLQDQQNGKILSANNKILQKLARSQSLNKKFQLYYFKDLKHYIPQDFYQFNKDRPFQRLRSELLEESEGNRYNGQNMINIVNRLKMPAEVKASIQQLTDLSRTIGQRLNQVLESLQNIDEYVTNSQQIAEIMHAAGINIRYIGLLYEKCKEEWLKRLLCTEIVTRCSKYYCKFDLQEATFNLQAQTIDKATQFQTKLIIRHLNELLGNSKQTDAMWKTINKHAAIYFKCTVSKNQIHEGYLIEAIQHHYGIRLKNLPKQLNIFRTNNALSTNNFDCFIVKSKTYNPNFTDLYVAVNSHLNNLNIQSYEQLTQLLNLQKREQIPSHFKLNNTYNRLILFIGNWLSPKDNRLIDTQPPSPSKLFFLRRLTNIKWFLSVKDQSSAQSLRDEVVDNVERWLGTAHPILTELYEIFSGYHVQDKEGETKALTYAKAAIKNQQRLLSEMHIKLAEGYYGLAQTHIAFNHKEEALQAFARAREVMVRNDAQETQAFGKICLKMGELYLSLNQTEDALQCASYACNTLQDNQDLHLSSVELLCRCYEVNQMWEQYAEYAYHTLAPSLNMYLKAEQMDKAIKLVILPFLHEIANSKTVSDRFVTVMEQLTTVNRNQDKAHAFLKDSIAEGTFPSKFIEGLREIEQVLQEIQTNGVINRWRGFENIGKNKSNLILFVAFMEALNVFLSGNFLQGAITDA